MAVIDRVRHFHEERDTFQMRILDDGVAHRAGGDNLVSLVPICTSVVFWGVFLWDFLCFPGTLCMRF